MSRENESPSQHLLQNTAESESPSEEVRIWRSEELLCGRQEVLIVHGDETYRLRCTRNGKLILQK